MYLVYITIYHSISIIMTAQHILIFSKTFVCFMGFFLAVTST